MDRVFDFIPILIFDNFSSNEQKPEPRYAYGIRGNALQALYFFARDDRLGHKFHIAPDVICQHHQLKECIVVFEFC